MQSTRKRQHQLDGWQDDISAKRPAPRRFEGSSPGTLAQSNALEMEFSEERRSFSLPSATGITCNPDVPMADATTIPDWSDRVCYGALCNSKAQILSREIQIKNVPQGGLYMFRVVHRRNCYFLVDLDDDAIDFAVVDFATAVCLDSLLQFASLSLAAVASFSELPVIPSVKSRNKPVIDITVNISGPKHLAEEVGKAIAAASGYLQHPLLLDPGTVYINPHYLYPGDQVTDLSHLIGPVKVDTLATRVSREVETILDSLDGESGLRSLQDTTQNGQDIISVLSPQLLNTQLKSHQIDGIKFIIDKENPNICESVIFDLVCLVEKHPPPARPGSCLGGILADVMGLGKTLTTLSAVAYTKQAASELASAKFNASDASSMVKATLVVLPSKQVLDVWESEVKRRFKPKTLVVAVFHGERRAKSPDLLVECDILLTTYHTLAADWKGRKILQKINWFRVILDEAHWIRNQSTTLFKSCRSLRTERRWCLTGTPIQNSMDDLRSLLKFLRFEPFSKAQYFKEHIMKPICSESDDSFRNLRSLMRVICIRRTETQLNLPPLVTEIVPVVLSTEESTMYECILRDCQSQLDEIVSTNSRTKQFSVLFTTIMKLRRLCNHGTISLPESELTADAQPGKHPRSRNIPSGIGADTACELCSIDGNNSNSLLEGLNACSLCGRWLALDVATLEDPIGKPSGSPIPRSPIDASLRLSPARLENGVSSKLLRVTNNICSLSVGCDTKSIVFTSWRLTTDILTTMLSVRGISSLQVDGRIPLADRSAILSKFRDDPAIPVLLLSIDSGSVGLNLTNANYIHIVEPQYNPTTEMQAIARAFRIGQTRQVTVFKYVTQKTVEMNIAKRQERKIRLAKISLGGSANESTNDALDDLKFILDYSPAERR